MSVHHIFLHVAFVLICFAGNRGVTGCTVIIATKEVTVDGTTLLAHSDDSGGTASDIRVINVPAQDHAKGELRAVYNFENGYPRVITNDRGSLYKPIADQKLSKPLGYISQVPHTYAYFDQDYGMVNEMKLAIAESTCAAKTVGWPMDKPYGFNMFSIAELSKVALERCVSARCAVKTMGEFAVKYGFFSEDSGPPDAPAYDDSAEALAISDRYGETWIFHVLTGLENRSAIWAAQRVPPGHISGITNSFVIREMNLSDSKNFLASDDVTEVARKKGWWDPSIGPFDFTAAYGIVTRIPLVPLYVGRRMWRIFDWFAPSQNFDPTLGAFADIPTYPFSVKPDNKVHVKDVMSLLRDHYEGTPYDMTQGEAAGPFGNPNRFDGSKKGVEGGWERPISIFRALFSFIVQISEDSQDDNGCILWYGQDKAHGTVYVPFSCNQQRVPEAYIHGLQSRFDFSSAWRAFNFVNNWAMLRFNIISVDIVNKQVELEKEAFSLVDEVYACRRNTSCLGEETARNYISRKYNGFAAKVVQEWWRLAWDLIGKYSDGYITTGEGEGEQIAPGYPAWWLSSTEFSKWPGNTFNPPKPKQPGNNLLRWQNIV